MTRITIGESQVEVEASIIAAALGLTPDDLRAAMRAGRITTRVERGEGQDSGRWRLTFFAPGRRLRLVVDAEGRVLTTSLADHARRGAAAGPGDHGPDGSSEPDGGEVSSEPGEG